MRWSTLLINERLQVPPAVYTSEKPDFLYDDIRSNFEMDYDRIIFSSSFRRLGKKTQVHPMSKNDHLHTRLTHSLETASIGRSLGFKIAKSEDEFLKEEELSNNRTHYDLATIVQAACLAHDIGNPPFGHAGEEAIRAWFRENEGFLEELAPEERNDFLFWEGNAQAFRVLTQIEHHLFSGGMQLTYPVLGAMVKYPWTSNNRNANNKFGCFWAERNILSSLCQKLGMKKTQGVNFHWARHPLAFLTEAADDVCYRILDIEDAHELGIVSFEKIKGIFSSIIKNNDNKKQEKTQNYIDDAALSDRRKMSYLRALTLNRAVDEVAKAFCEKRDEIMAGELQSSLIDHISPELHCMLDKMSETAKKRIFKEKRKVELELGAYSTMSTLLENFCLAAREMTSGKNASSKTRQLCDLMGEKVLKREDSLYSATLRVLDYISGMTDNYAVYIANQLRGACY